jgi:beta-lactamase regulating signal transducer with metallopeptidase domain
MLDSILSLASSPVATLTAWGRPLASWLMLMNAWTAALLAGALLLDRLLASRTRASWRIALYAPVVLRLLLPPAWKIPLAHAPSVVTLLTPVPDALPPPERALAAAPSVTWQAALVVGYAAVALVLAFVRVRARLRLRRELAHARPVLGRSLTASAPCPVVEHPELGPMVVGVLRPRIVLPSLLLAPEEEAHLACVLGHESAHIRRRDPWLMTVTQVFTVTLWPVLPLWIAAARVRALVEMACDEMALGDADPNERSRYGHALLDMAEWRTMTLAPLGAGELHFGSTLRARIEALASHRHWPGALQVTLVAGAVVAFAACSSVGPASVESTTSSEPQAAIASVATRRLIEHGDLQHRCPHFVERFEKWSDPVHEWMNGPVQGIPVDEVTDCRGTEVRAYVEDTLWAAEARNVMGQMARDLYAAYVRDSKNGKLCPSDGPVPRTPPPRGQPYAPTPADWSGPGFSCMQFAIDADHPIYFQYTLDTNEHGFGITARAQHPRGDHAVAVTMILEGHIRPDNDLELEANIKELWKDVP